MTDNKIADWAQEMVSRLDDAEDYHGIHAYDRLRNAFARYIMSKEEPPVDPDLIEARKIAAELNKDDSDFILRGDVDAGWTVKAALAGIKKGRGE